VLLLPAASVVGAGKWPAAIWLISSVWIAVSSIGLEVLDGVIATWVTKEPRPIIWLVPRGAAEVDDVGIVLGQPVDVGAVEDLLVEGGDTGRGGIEDLCQVLAVAAAGGAAPP
jgi:hypothetical protein